MLLATFLLSATTALADVHIFTEEYPPYNYRQDDGEIVGYATQLVRLVMDESGLQYDISLAPWTRAVRFTETSDSTLIYSIARTEVREKRFHWLVPLAADTYHLFGSATRNHAVTRETLQSGAFSLVCIAADISCLLLERMGVPEKAIVRQADLDRPGSLKLVETGRVDFFVGGIRDYHINIVEMGFRRDAFKPVFDLNLGMTLYLGGGLGLNPVYREAIQSAYNRLLESGAYQKLQQETFGSLVPKANR